jgi:hypothetical protein
MQLEVSLQLMQQPQQQGANSPLQVCLNLQRAGNSSLQYLQLACLLTCSSSSRSWRCSSSQKSAQLMQQ